MILSSDGDFIQLQRHNKNAKFEIKQEVCKMANIPSKVTESFIASLTETFNSKQEVINYFISNGKTAAQGASAWERGWRGAKAKTSNTPVANKPRTDWMSKWERDQNESINEAQLDEEDKLIDPKKGHKRKTGLHGKSEEPRLGKLKGPFKSNEYCVIDSRGREFCECTEAGVAGIIAKALNEYSKVDEMKVQGAGALAGGLQYESEIEDEESLLMLL